MKFINMVGVSSIGITLIASSALAQQGDPRPGDPGYVEFPSGVGFPNPIDPPVSTLTSILVNNTGFENKCYFNDDLVDGKMTIPFDAPNAGSGTIEIAAWDVDSPTEKDEVFLNGDFLGYLEGDNQDWSVTKFPPLPVHVKAGLNKIEIEVDVDNPPPDGLWCTAVDWVFIDVQATPGVCVLDFDKDASYENYPSYFNDSGFFNHPIDETIDRGPVSRFLSCYERLNEKECEDSIGTQKMVEGKLTTVTSGHWYGWAEDCEELREENILTDEVKLLAADVNLTATRNGSGVDLELTTSSETNTTAVLSILRGEKQSNGGTKIDPVCHFPSGGSPYSCTDGVVGDSYRVLETEYNGDIIVYDEVTPE